MNQSNNQSDSTYSVYGLRSFRGDTIQASKDDRIRKVEMVTLPNCTITVVTFREPLSYADAKKLILADGVSGGLWPLRIAGFPEISAWIGKEVARALRDVATAVVPKNKDLTLFDRQATSTRRSTSPVRSAGKKKPARVAAVSPARSDSPSE